MQCNLSRLSTWGWGFGVKVAFSIENPWEVQLFSGSETFRGYNWSVVALSIESPREVQLCRSGTFRGCNWSGGLHFQLKTLGRCSCSVEVKHFEVAKVQLS